MKKTFIPLALIFVCVFVCACGAKNESPVPAAQTPQPVPEATSEPTAEELYGSVLSKYYAAVSAQAGAEELTEAGLNYMLAYGYGDAPLESAGYALMDADGDGLNELLIGSLTGDIYNRQVVLDLYTVTDGELRLVFTSGERDRFYLCSDGTVAEEASSGAMNSAWNYYDFRNGEIAERQSLVFNAAEDRENPWHSLINGEDSPLSEEDAMNYFMAYQNLYITPEYIPFSQLGA